MFFKIRFKSLYIHIHFLQINWVRLLLKQLSIRQSMLLLLEIASYASKVLQCCSNSNN